MSFSVAVLNEVQEALAGRAVKDRRGLVRHVTDLFLVNAAALSNQEIARFDDVLSELIREIDTAARALLALRLAPVRNAPARLMQSLALDDEPDVACPVLCLSEQLDDRTLVMVARHKSQEHLFAISRRQFVSATVTDELLHRGDKNVIISIAGNAGSQWSVRGLDRLAERAEGDDELTVCVAKRPDIPTQLLAVLIRAASEQVRRKLEEEVPHASREIGHAVQSAAIHVARRHESQARDTGRARETVERLHETGRLDDKQIGSFAEDGFLEEIKVSLSVISGLPLQFIEQVLKQETGEMLVVIARATRLSWPTVKHILELPIWRHPATSGEIRQCLARYTKLGRSTACDILAFYKKRQ